MKPSYRSGQLALLNKLDKAYTRGDVILFYSEELECNLVKRIAALPGDTVQIRNGDLYINADAVLPYPGCPNIVYEGLATNKITVPEDQYFVLGDNFPRSIDSRHSQVGFVRSENIKGKIT